MTETRDEELARLRKELDEARAELNKARKLSDRAMAVYQQRAQQMEIIRQQNEDLDRLAADLSRAKKAEEHRAREIESAARLKSEFLANFSHEIRTPLNGILGYCDLLTREEGQRLTAHGRRDLGVIRSNAKTLLALINDILDLSKIESGHVEVVEERVDLNELANECADTVRELLKGKDVELVVNVADELKSIKSDELKLRQILNNLLSNAAKFTELGEISLEAKVDGDQLRVDVVDTGCGMARDQLPFIFDKFRQVDGTHARRSGGTGLGLAIVKELCRVLGGTVTADSTLGRGSHFTVRLPVGGLTESDSVEVAQRPEAPEVPAIGDRVLIIDDDPAVASQLRSALEEVGFRVAEASDGIDALSKARASRPSAIVLDLRLPKLDGWSVLSQLKSDPELASVPVVIISIEEQRAKGFALGASDYLVKPFDAERLVESVTAFVSPAHGEVLVVDDDADTRQLVCRQLRGAGFTAAEASGGEEALLRLRVTEPSLVILDLVMPGLDGFTVLESMRKSGAATPVIVLTGATLTEQQQDVLERGMAHIILKEGGAIDTVIDETRRLIAARRPSASDLPRVLYIEDVAQNRDVVRRYLEGVFHISEAHDGEHGLTLLESQPFDAALVDLSLPRLDGFEVIRRVRATKRLQELPLVVLTAHADRSDEAKARGLGASDYLTKPVERDTLIARLEHALGGRRRVAE